MNHKTKELAGQAGYVLIHDYCTDGDVRAFSNEELERFAELIRQDEAKACAEHYLAIMRDAVEQAVLRERESCAKLCEDEAKKHEQAAQDCIDNNELDEVSAIRSTCWKLAVCAEAIKAKKETT